MVGYSLGGFLELVSTTIQRPEKEDTCDLKPAKGETFVLAISAQLGVAFYCIIGFAGGILLPNYIWYLQIISEPNAEISQVDESAQSH